MSKPLFVEKPIHANFVHYEGHQSPSKALNGSEDDEWRPGFKSVK